MPDRFFEDYVPGTTSEHGPILVVEADVLEFARRFDPQPFHVDARAAEAGPFKGLIASGWHTCALMMRVLVDDYLTPASSVGSPGIDELRWLRPVRPGDRLIVRTTVDEARVSRSDPTRGILTTRIELINQVGDAVLRMIAINMVLTRPGARGR